jgi:tetratricopeptide (TPR) repeat protein
VQLLDTADGRALWTKVIDREVEDVFAVEEEIAAAVVDALHVRRLPGRALAGRALRTRSPAAHAAYLRGRKLLMVEALREVEGAEAAFRQALALDPDYAPAWAGLALAVYYTRGNDGPSLQLLEAGRAEALAAAEKAVALAPDSAEGYLVRGNLRLWIRFDVTGAFADMRRAVAINPGDPDGLRTIAREVLGATGQFTQGLADARRACELDPLSHKPWSTLSGLYLATGQLDLARSTAERSMELQPKQDLAIYDLAMVALLKGQTGEAIEIARRTDEPVSRLMFEAMGRHSEGRREDSEAALQRLVAENAQDAAFQIATVHAWRGEPDQAFQWLDRAVDQRDGGLTELNLEPAFQRLERDPGFPRLLARLGLVPQ